MKNYIKFNNNESKEIFLSTVGQYFDRNFSIGNDNIGEFAIKDFDEFEYIIGKINECGFTNPVVALSKSYNAYGTPFVIKNKIFINHDVHEGYFEFMDGEFNKEQSSYGDIEEYFDINFSGARADCNYLYRNFELGDKIICSANSEVVIFCYEEVEMDLFGEIPDNEDLN